MNKHKPWIEKHIVTAKNPIQIIDGKKYKVCSRCKELLPIHQFRNKSDYNPTPLSRCAVCVWEVARNSLARKKKNSLKDKL